GLLLLPDHAADSTPASPSYNSWPPPRLLPHISLASRPQPTRYHRTHTPRSACTIRPDRPASKVESSSRQNGASDDRPYENVSPRFQSLGRSCPKAHASRRCGRLESRQYKEGSIDR